MSRGGNVRGGNVRFPFVCTELIEETGRFRKLIFGISGQNFPSSNKLRFSVDIFQISPSYESYDFSHIPKTGNSPSFLFSECVKNHITAYNSHLCREKILKL